MDSIPHPFQSLVQELQTDSRRVSVEVVPNYSILKGKKCLMISMRNYLSVYCGGTTSVVQLKLTGTKSQAQQRKLSVTAGQAFQWYLNDRICNAMWKFLASRRKVCWVELNFSRSLDTWICFCSLDLCPYFLQVELAYATVSRSISVSAYRDLN